MSLALSEGQIDQSQTLREQNDRLCVGVHMKRERLNTGKKEKLCVIGLICLPE